MARLVSPRRAAARVAVAVIAAALCCISCGASSGQLQPQTIKQQLEAQVDLARKAPPVLRWNPAPCDCPPFELQLASGWIRAELRSGDLEKIQQWTAFLGTSPPESLPVAVTVQGQLERGVWRLANGTFAVRVDVAEPLSPTAPPAAAPAATVP